MNVTRTKIDRPVKLQGGVKCPMTTNCKLGLRNQLNTGQPLNAVWERRLRQALIQSMRTYVTDLYPTRAEYARVAEALVRQYPHLEDKSHITLLSNMQSPDGTGNGTNAIR
ncbi:Bifunctional lysine-specific demethylase and histidyl-hydroxylase NO66 [Frankliniella fusca]|uniref:Bifunctional lysine-specific demethylase and histidyl-hydroxylase NO66 n=1 Tax=Frankliniella fusca TaxID=407009 RepID=A0AAE1HHK3_9NEOP|nr:Bifunctional lysine-specific demethylase and histidyl-hydroxylase NO66 [Frankliniella fusca]